MTFVDENRFKGNHAQATVSAWLSRKCLVRPVAEGTDIGMDLYCESILDGNPFLHFWAQVKAIPADAIVVESEKTFASYRFERRHLLYWDRQPIPVYAFLVPFEGWPSAAPDKIYGVRITEQLVRNGIPESLTVTYRTSDCFSANSLDHDLNEFISKIVPWDTSAMLLKRGIVAPLPKTSTGSEDAFPSGIGFQDLPRILTTMRDAAVHGLSHSLIAEHVEPTMHPLRCQFQALAEFFEDSMHNLGLSMLVRAAHFDGDTERAKGYVLRAIARIDSDQTLSESGRAAQVQRIRILLDDFD